LTNVLALLTLALKLRARRSYRSGAVRREPGPMLREQALIIADAPLAIRRFRTAADVTVLRK